MLVVAVPGDLEGLLNLMCLGMVSFRRRGGAFAREGDSRAGELQKDIYLAEESHLSVAQPQ